MRRLTMPNDGSERVTGKPEIMPDCGTNFRLADNPTANRNSCMLLTSKISREP